MKKLFVSIASILMAITCFASVDFTKADALFTSTKFAESKEELISLLNTAAPGVEKASVLWRLSRICVILGQDETTKEGKREVFGKGIQYAEQAIKENPKEAQAYMWHSANVGRECQTRSMMEQAKKVSVMMNDLTMILDKLGRKDCSEAWQALAEIYYNHPFKSTDAAANFTRQAALTIPQGELRLSTYALLAKILMERGWTAEKRQSEAAKNNSKFNVSSISNIDKYTYLDGSLSKGTTPAWSNKPYIQLSDKEEASDILNYSTKLYTNTQNKNSVMEKDYKLILELKKKLK